MRAHKKHRSLDLSILGVELTTTMMNTKRFNSTIVANRRLSELGYELTFKREGFTFKAGHLINLQGRDVYEERSYNLASGENEEHLRVLYRLFPEGYLTPQLITLNAGDSITFSGPFGNFLLEDPTRPVVFIATGTGIAPCCSFLYSHPELDLTLLHGVRHREDLYYQSLFENYTYFPCISNVSEGQPVKRVTDVLNELELNPNAQYYLCGANEMIYDVDSILRKRNIPESNIFSEAYYYRFIS